MTSQVIGALLPDLACSPRRSRQLRRRPGPFTPFGECCIGCNSAYLGGGDERVSERVRSDGLGDPGAARELADDPPGAVPVQAAFAFGEEDRRVAAFAGGQVDRPGGARGERDGDDLAALAGNGQGPVATLQAQVLYISAGGLGDPQPVQREQRDQRMLGRRAKPGGHQQRAQLVAVQGGGMGLVIQPRPSHVSGRGMVQELFLDRVPVEPGNGTQPAGDGRAGAAPGLEFSGEAFDVGAADREQRQGAGAAPGGELAQVHRVGLSCQSAVSGQEPGEGEPFWVGEGGLDRGEGSGWGGSGHRAPPGRAETREAGPAAGPSDKAETHRKVRPLVTPAHKPQQLKSKPAALEMLEIAEYALDSYFDLKKSES